MTAPKLKLNPEAARQLELKAAAAVRDMRLGMSAKGVTVNPAVTVRSFRILGLKVALGLLWFQRGGMIQRQRRELADLDKRIADTRAELKRQETAS